ncbi:hypothetical protein PTTW11_03229 [Pyrenophora teres f. teres]|uniref:Uncharacterized protein n=1 Tax=Pyrenophora teres f. teres TaxID=97479 RepID=A0A6S6VTT6_9PLEO|nr:hypothetical protein PTTW11_03229 [Pyrenophora teres f. teres]
MKLFAVIIMVIPAVLAACAPIGNDSLFTCRAWCQDSFPSRYECPFRQCTTCRHP